jgi:hypothetical protein
MTMSMVKRLAAVLLFAPVMTAWFLSLPVVWIITGEVQEPWVFALAEWANP